jgi:hypothetical protein|tara:strand:- start:269 stop:733 length:465 start_codon:yes stop_codon:yes gene_type:complete
MAFNSNDKYLSLTTLDTIPLSTATSVTVTASLGGNTFSLSAAPSLDFIPGAWIWDKTNNKLYQVRDLDNTRTFGSIVGTFDNALSTTTIAFIGFSDVKMNALGIVALADTTINGTALATGSSYNRKSENGFSRKISPVIVDGATGAVNYLISKI